MSALDYSTATSEEVIASMMTERIGHSILDSGDYYGRAYDRNQKAVAEAGLSDVEFFQQQPEVTFDIWEDEVEGFTISVFHWMRANLSYAPDLDAEFHAQADDDTPWLAEAEKFAEARHDYQSHESVRSVNTYNHDSWLSQVLQWVEFTDESGDSYAIVQVHGGADVRGGYTVPRVFQITAEYLGEEAVDIYCTNRDTATTLDGEDVLVCRYGLTVRVGDAAYTYDGDVHEGPIGVVKEGAPACPSCGDPLAGALVEY